MKGQETTSGIPLGSNPVLSLWECHSGLSLPLYALCILPALDNRLCVLCGPCTSQMRLPQRLGTLGCHGQPVHKLAYEPRGQQFGLLWVRIMMEEWG